MSRFQVDIELEIDDEDLKEHAKRHLGKDEYKEDFNKSEYLYNILERMWIKDFIKDLYVEKVIEL
jgi:hypothetical protein